MAGERSQTREPIPPVIVKFWKVEVAFAGNLMVVEAVAAVKVPVVEAADKKITAGSASGLVPDLFKILRAPNEPELPERVPERVCGDEPFKNTVPELWVKVELLV